MPLTFKTSLDDSEFMASLRKMGNGIGEFGTTVQSLGRAAQLVFGGAVVGAIGRAAQSVIDYGSGIRDAADATDLSAESFQRLRFAFGQSGTEAEQFTTGMQTLAKNMQAAKDGNETAVRSFERMGVSVKDLRDANTEEVLLQVADGAKNAGSETEAMAATMDLLGRAGKKMIPGLKEGRDAIEELGKTAKIVADRDLAELDKAGDLITKTMQSLKASAAGGLAGLLRGPDLGDRDRLEQLKAENEAAKKTREDEARAEEETSDRRIEHEKEADDIRDKAWKRQLERVNEVDKFQRNAAKKLEQDQEKAHREQKAASEEIIRVGEEGQKYLDNLDRELREKAHREAMDILDDEKSRRIDAMQEANSRMSAAQSKLERDTGEAVRKGLMTPQDRRAEEMADKREAREQRRLDALVADPTKRGTRQGDAERVEEIRQDKRALDKAKQEVTISKASIKELVDAIDKLQAKP